MDHKEDTGSPTTNWKAMREHDYPPTRRDLFRHGVATTAALGVAGTAGCLGAVPPLGKRPDSGRVDVPDGGAPTYCDWLPAPSTASTGNANIRYVEPADLASAGRLRPFYVGQFAWGLDWLGRPFQDYDRVIGRKTAAGQVTALLGDIDPSAVRDALDGTGYEQVDEYEGTRRFARSDDPRAVAVGQDAVVIARGEQPLAATATATMLDASAGRIDRRTDVDAAFDRVTAAVAAQPFLMAPALFFQVPGDVQTSAFAEVPTEDDRYYVNALHYPDAATPSEAELRDAIAENGESDGALTEVRTDGPLAVLEQRVDPDTEQRPLRYRLATWGVQRDGRTVTFHHEAGESYDPALLSVRSDRERIEDDLEDRFDSVGPGDRIEVTVPADAETVVLEHVPYESDTQVPIRWRER